MEFIEKVKAALRNSPSFPFVKSCEVACENVIYDAADELYRANGIEDWMFRDYGSSFCYWMEQAEWAFARMGMDGEL